LRSARRPPGDPERDQHEEQEHPEGWRHDFPFFLLVPRPSSSSSKTLQIGEKDEEENE
jgi:hypothetical protein